MQICAKRHDAVEGLAQAEEQGDAVEGGGPNACERQAKAAPYKIVYNSFPVRQALLFPKQDAVTIRRDLLHCAGPA